MNFGKLERGWLALLTEGEYRVAVRGLPVCVQAELNDSQEAGVQSRVRANWVGAPTQAVSGDSVQRMQQRAEPVGCVELLALSEGFDERAQALYNNLVAAH